MGLADTMSVSLFDRGYTSRGPGAKRWKPGCVTLPGVTFVNTYLL